MSEKINPELEETVFEIVNNQLDANDPPITRQTFQRLKAEGNSDEEAKEYIGCVVVREVLDISQSGNKFELERYSKYLSALPNLPED